MNLRQVVTPRVSTVTDNTSLPTTVAFAAYSAIGNIGETLEHGRFVSSMDERWLRNSELGSYSAVAPRDEESGIPEDEVLDTARIEGGKDEIIGVSVQR